MVAIEERTVCREFGPYRLIFLSHRNQFVPKCGIQPIAILAGSDCPRWLIDLSSATPFFDRKWCGNRLPKRGQNPLNSFEFLVQTKERAVRVKFQE